MRLRRLALALATVCAVMPTAVRSQIVNKPKQDKRTTCRSIMLGGLKLGCETEVFETLKPNWNSATDDQVLGPFKSGQKWVSCDIQRVTYFDDQMMPQSELYWKTITIGSSRQILFVTADYRPDSIFCKILTTIDGQIQDSETKTIPIPKDADVTSSIRFRQGDKLVGPGAKMDVWQLDMDKLELVKTAYNALCSQAISAAGKDYKTIAFGRNGVGPCLWVADNEGIIRTQDAASGVQTTPCTVDEAAKTTVSDISGISCDKKITDPLNVRELNVQFTEPGTLDLPADDDRQITHLVKDKNLVDFHVTASVFDPKTSAMLPIDGKDYSEWLSPGKGIESADTDIVAKAKEIVGNEKNAYQAACKLRKWVHDYITDSKPCPVSAVEVMKSKSGDCRHFVTLYTALARACGIPTRIVTGLKYSDGRFWGHTWAESFVGKWVPIDPTQDSDFVDATHIEFAVLNGSDGLKSSDLAALDLAKLAGLCKIGQDFGFLTGKSKAQILDYK